MLDLLVRFRTTVLLTIYVIFGFGLLLSERQRVPDEEVPLSEDCYVTNTGPVGSVTMHTVALMQDATFFATAGVGDFWDRYIDLVRVNEENEELRAELNRLREENTRLLGVMQENARLRAMVGFAEAHPELELVPARVVAREISDFFRVIRIQIDTDGRRVDENMPVVSSAGVVGWVQDASGPYADVMLAVDPRSSIDVVVQRNRARGVLEGLGHSNDYQSRIQYLLRRDGAEEGDIVVTSGMGGRFPPDLLVGRIDEVEERNFGMYQEVIVEPATDFSRLEEVFVIVNYEP